LPFKRYDPNQQSLVEKLTIPDIKIQILDVKLGETKRTRTHLIHDSQRTDRSNLPPQEKTMERLQHEGQVIVGAGLETVKWTMCVALFHVLDKPAIKQCLDAELLKAWPDIGDSPKIGRVGKSPYLTAVIQEGGYSFIVFLQSGVLALAALRLSYGVAFRLLVRQARPFQYKSHTIHQERPSQPQLYLHHNEDVFPPQTPSTLSLLADPITGRSTLGQMGKNC